MAALYQLLPIGVLKTDTAQRIVPASGDLWREYQAWLRDGNVPDPYVPPATDPVAELAAAKAERWQYIRARWAQAEAAGFTWNGNAYDSDQRALNRLWPSIVRAATDNGAFSLNWTTSDNTVVALSKANLIALNLALQTHLQTQHDRAQQRRASINAAATVAAVNAVEW